METSLAGKLLVATPELTDDLFSRSVILMLQHDEETAEGVDAKASKKHLYEIAQRLDVPGRSTMDKDELVDAIKKANRRETARSRT